MLYPRMLVSVVIVSNVVGVIVVVPLPSLLADEVVSKVATTLLDVPLSLLPEAVPAPEVGMV